MAKICPCKFYEIFTDGFNVQFLARVKMGIVVVKGQTPPVSAFNGAEQI